MPYFNSMFRATPSYFYHSFPRRRDGVDPVERGLQILHSIADFGFVLAPEIRHWKQPNSDGTLREHHSVERRISFTQLTPRQLRKHSKRFGPFALEFEVQELRHLGGLPVFYIPQTITSDAGASSLALTFVFQLYDCQFTMNNLHKLSSIASSGNDLIPLCNIGDDGNVINSYRVPSATLRDVISFIQFRTSPFHLMAGTLDGVSNLFCSTDDPTDDKLLAFYREREWRIIGNVARNGIVYTRNINQTEKDKLTEIDPEYWNRTISGGSHSFRRVDEILILPSFEGNHIVHRIRRIIVPPRAVRKAKEIFESANLAVKVVSSRQVCFQSLFDASI